jgi:diguanylate cyclase (GGDEF)-like protein
MLDLDGFKRVNDKHGHLEGDRVLSTAAEGMQTALRPQDALGRYGGDEFLVVLPDCDAAAAIDIATRLRARVTQRSADLEAAQLARQIARKLEDDLQYPGQIEVTVIREFRAKDYAR